MRLDDAKRVLQRARPELLERFGVTTILIFGSVARGEDRPDSDIDLLVEFDRPVTLIGLFRLQSHLEELLGCSVDIGTPAGLRPRVRDRVLAEAVRVA
jgi:predicted nucleotidyltransferase